jgi:hypothetical protein
MEVVSFIINPLTDMGLIEQKHTMYPA